MVKDGRNGFPIVGVSVKVKKQGAKKLLQMFKERISYLLGRETF
jgi:hypothetical protein